MMISSITLAAFILAVSTGTADGQLRATSGVNTTVANSSIVCPPGTYALSISLSTDCTNAGICINGVLDRTEMCSGGEIFDVNCIWTNFGNLLECCKNTTMASCPTLSPTGVPTTSPSAKPSAAPNSSPSGHPTITSSDMPSSVPTATPSTSPTSSPSIRPSSSPTATPSASPSAAPTLEPTYVPSSSPTMDRTGFGADFDVVVAVSDKKAVTTEGSPQYRALHWLVNDDPLQLTVMASNATATVAMGLSSTTEDMFVQRYSLAVLIFALTEGSPTPPKDLLPSEDECTLKTIGCDEADKITTIKFANKGLTEHIPEEIGQFALTLTKLDLADNSIIGGLPNALYRLRMLEGLYLKSNKLSGTLSTKLGNLKYLKELYAGENEFTGPLPLELQKCRRLRILSLYKNEITGTIPSWTPPMPKLLMLDLGYNNLNGTLTESLVPFNWLRNLYLDHNSLTGTIPETYPAMANLKLAQMQLEHNHLTGEVPKDWWNGQDYQRHLLSLGLDHNDFDEKLDKKICKLFVLDDKAEMVELRADCDICSCEICEPYCY